MLISRFSFSYEKEYVNFPFCSNVGSWLHYLVCAICVISYVVAVAGMVYEVVVLLYPAR